jgi:hypothetical protein
MMKKGLTYLIFVFFVLSGCIEPYVPKIEGSADEVYVVNGEVINLPGYQSLSVSRASSISDPKYIPLSSCLIVVEDDKGNTFAMEEYEAGKYRVWMDQNDLVPGNSYRVHIKTPSGEEIQSDFDRMPSPSVIDSIYFERKDTYQKNTGLPLKGLQFYIDFHCDDTENTYFRWVADETWEHHAPLPMEYYYDGSSHRIRPPDYTYNICWSTKPEEHIFTLSTFNLVSNSYKMFPLQYVDNTTNKLLIKYSAMISQFALSHAAFVFWEQLRINSDEQGGLYEKQPLPVEGNLHNLSNTRNKVIGFFGASSVAQKRIFADGISDMNITDGAFCSPEELGIGGWRNIDPGEYPLYFTYVSIDGTRQLRTLQRTCVDCRALGGTIVKPDFWP